MSLRLNERDCQKLFEKLRMCLRERERERERERKREREAIRSFERVMNVCWFDLRDRYKVFVIECVLTSFIVFVLLDT